jgi:hypothetical protein
MSPLAKKKTIPRKEKNIPKPVRPSPISVQIELQMSQIN